MKGKEKERKETKYETNKKQASTGGEGKEFGSRQANPLIYN